MEVKRSGRTQQNVLVSPCEGEVTLWPWGVVGSLWDDAFQFPINVESGRGRGAAGDPL